MQIIPSVLYPSRLAYKLQSSADTYDKRGAAPLIAGLTQFETYGDGLIQHSADWCVQFADCTDALLSLAAAILANAGLDEWQDLPHPEYHWQKAEMRFAFSVRYVEGKRRFYSRQERKVSSADSKRHDKRWEEIQPLNNGSGQSAFAMLCTGNPDWLERIWLAVQLSEVSHEDGLGYQSAASILAPLKELPPHWENAFHAYEYARTAYNAKQSAARTIKGTLENLAAQAQEPAPAAA